MTEVSFTVGKLDASIALLLTADHHLIEFPTILLPDGIKPGSFVTIKANQDSEKEESEKKKFEEIQDSILSLYGTHEPKAPVLKIKNVTQTSAVLEWDAIELGSAQIKALTLYKNGVKLGRIPNPLANMTTKLSGLQLNTKYDFKLRMDTTAGVYYSNDLSVTTHKMTDLSGITVCIGDIQAHEGISTDDIVSTLHEMGARPLQTEVSIDTTHFIATAGNGLQWKKALDSNIPVVRPEWLRACAKERRIIGVRNFYLDCDPESLKDFKFVKKEAEVKPEDSPQAEVEAPISQEPAQAQPNEESTTIKGETEPTEKSLPEPEQETAPIEEEITQEVSTEDVTVGNSTVVAPESESIREEDQSQGSIPVITVLTDTQEEAEVNGETEPKEENITTETQEATLDTTEEAQDFDDVELNKETDTAVEEQTEEVPDQVTSTKEETEETQEVPEQEQEQEPVVSVVEEDENENETEAEAGENEDSGKAAETTEEPASETTNEAPKVAKKTGKKNKSKKRK
ncbi:hypothetical protein WICPIJ_000826 [Wickerhamomyces pijperi]|uniref:Chitin biosynthesis protein CHS5 n=1 Tax=Wickerhamomyces pijperi TaxID=599730 RepID=A0A9P8QFB0_WICPI|nr:hypothetical protein WICPIJ_000826 [Wickerhamomyces pijperi]